MVQVTFPATMLADEATRKALGHGFVVIDGILRQTEGSSDHGDGAISTRRFPHAIASPSDEGAAKKHGVYSNGIVYSGD